MLVIVFSDGTFFEFNENEVRILNIVTQGPNENFVEFDGSSDAERWEIARQDGRRLNLNPEVLECGAFDERRRQHICGKDWGHDGPHHCGFNCGREW